MLQNPANSDISQKKTLIYLFKVLILAVLYILTGKLGLSLAVSPGYATIIWPPSGLATGALMVHRWRIWPGILLGSWLLNSYIGHGFDVSHGLHLDRLFLALVIAAGSTIQALIAYGLVQRFIGLPLRLNRLADVGKLIILAGPLACLVAASIGVTALHVIGNMPAEQTLGNWLTWWAGDIFGVLIFLPLAIIAPWNPHPLVWQNNRIGTLPILAMLAIFVPLGLTFYAWKTVTENTYERQQAGFSALVTESEKALIHRLDSYNYALLGGKAFIRSRPELTDPDWESYVQTIDIQNNFPGIIGLGWISSVSQSQLPDFLLTHRLRDGSALNVHPQSNVPPYDIVTFVEPWERNRAALGLNIAFEKNRLEAANLARDTGQPAITRPVELVQDMEHSPGFLMMHPVYRTGSPLNTVAARREALRGWVYAPFIASRLLRDLTKSQGTLISIDIYDGDQPNPQSLVYSSRTSHQHGFATFTSSQTLQVMQRKWLVVWSGLPAFERETRNDTGLFVLVGGLMFTGLFVLFLMMVMLRDRDIEQWVAQERQLVLPTIIFVLSAMAMVGFTVVLKQHELDYIQNIVSEKSNKINILLANQVSDHLSSINRMADRWAAEGGTPYALWREDAANLLNDDVGLKVLQWTDPKGIISWVEPTHGNEQVIGSQWSLDAADMQALQRARDNRNLSLLSPLPDAEGHPAMYAFAPVYVHNDFNGFLVGIFGIEDFFGKILDPELTSRFAADILVNGKPLFTRTQNHAALAQSLSVSNTLHLYDQTWEVRVTPTQEFVDIQLGNLTSFVLVGGLLISVLLALTVRAVLEARITSRDLMTSEETFRLAMQHASIGMALVSDTGRWLRVNQAMCDLIGYSEAELQQTDFQRVTHPDDLSNDLVLLEGLLSGRIPFYTLEKRYFHKNGTVIWTLLDVTLVRNQDDSFKYFIAQIQDITQRKQQEELLRASNHMKSAVLTSASCMMIATDVDGHVLVFNREAERCLGYRADEVVHLNTPMLWHDAIEVSRAAQMLSLELGRNVEIGLDVFVCKAQVHVPQTGEWTLIRKDGSRFPASLAVTPLVDAGQRIVGYLGILNDITDRKAMEKTLAEREENLRITNRKLISAQKFQHLIQETNPDLIFVKDAESRIIEANASFYEIYPAASHEEIVGTTTFEMFEGPISSLLQTKDREAFETGRSEALEQILLPNGQKRTMLTKKIRFYNEDGEVFLLGTSRDVTEREELLSKLADSNTELERFAYVASHDMQEPLRMISGFSDLVLRDYAPQLDEDGKTYLNIIHQGSERMRIMIRDLLAYARLDRGSIGKVEVKGELVLRDVRENLIELIREKQAMLTADPLPVFMGNPSQFMRLLQNLVTNAVKYQPKGKVPQVHIAVKKQPGELLFSVSDNGIGIDESYLQTVFEPFRRLHHWDEIKGTGMGLAVCKRIVENHGGKIWITSSKGNGSTVWFTIMSD